jgi:prevent-host-death family protein
VRYRRPGSPTIAFDKRHVFFIIGLAVYLTDHFEAIQMSPKPTTKLIDALSVRNHLGEVMEEVEKGNTRFLVSRRGKPKVVILGVQDYLKNIVKQPELLTRIQLSAETAGQAEIGDQEIEVEIAAYRKEKRGNSKGRGKKAC